MKLSGREKFWVAARILVGFVVAYAGFSKLTEPSANFEAALLRYGVFSPALIPILAKTVPWFEWIFGSFLMLGYAPRFSAVIVTSLYLGFLVALSSSQIFLAAGNTDCGCFGSSGWLHLSVRQIFIVDLAGFLLAAGLARQPIFPWSLHGFLVKQNRAEDDK